MFPNKANFPATESRNTGPFVFRPVIRTPTSCLTTKNAWLNRSTTLLVTRMRPWSVQAWTDHGTATSYRWQSIRDWHLASRNADFYLRASISWLKFLFFHSRAADPQIWENFLNSEIKKRKDLVLLVPQSRPYHLRNSRSLRSSRPFSSACNVFLSSTWTDIFINISTGIQILVRGLYLWLVRRVPFVSQFLSVREQSHKWKVTSCSALWIYVNIPRIQKDQW